MANKRLVSLRRKRDFDRLRENGRTAHPSNWLLVSFQSNKEEQIRCGFTLPRYVGGAVVRNRLKRWGKEYLRGWIKKNELSLDLNIIFKRREPDFFRNLSHDEFDQAFDKMFQILKRGARNGP